MTEQLTNPTEVGLAVEQSLIDQPDTIQQKLVLAVRGVARRISKKPEVVRALAAAELITPGLVIASDEQAAELADSVRIIILGEKAQDAEVRAILRIPEAMKEAVKSAVQEDRLKLQRARTIGNDARLARQAELRRRAQEEERRQREEVRLATEKAAREAAETGEDAPPEPEIAPVVVPRTIAGGIGKSGTQVRVDPKEIVDVSQVPIEWLTIVTAVARAVFLSEERSGRVRRADPGESVVYRGIRFESVETAVNR